MNAPSRSSVGGIFKGRSVSHLDMIIAAEKKDDGSDMTFSEAARRAVASYAMARVTPTRVSVAQIALCGTGK